MTASYEARGAIAVITLNNPPVNGLGYATATLWLGVLAWLGRHGG